MNTRKEIEKFLEIKKIAVAGVSRNPKKFGYLVYEALKKRGYEVYPVNPQAEDIDKDKMYHSVSDLPGDVKQLLIVTPKKETDSVLREAINKGITNIWVQQMSETENTVKMAEEYQVGLIYRKCIFMFAGPVKGIHKFHRSLVQLFGRMPK